MNCSRLWTDGTPSLIKVTTVVNLQISKQKQQKWKVCWVKQYNCVNCSRLWTDGTPPPIKVTTAVNASNYRNNTGETEVCWV